MVQTTESNGQVHSNLPAPEMLPYPDFKTIDMGDRNIGSDEVIAGLNLSLASLNQRVEELPRFGKVNVEELSPEDAKKYQEVRQIRSRLYAKIQQIKGNIELVRPIKGVPAKVLSVTINNQSANSFFLRFWPSINRLIRILSTLGSMTIGAEKITLVRVAVKNKFAGLKTRLEDIEVKLGKISAEIARMAKEYNLPNAEDPLVFQAPAGEYPQLYAYTSESILALDLIRQYDAIISLAGDCTFYAPEYSKVVDGIEQEVRKEFLSLRQWVVDTIRKALRNANEIFDQLKAEEQLFIQDLNDEFANRPDGFDESQVILQEQLEKELKAPYTQPFQNAVGQSL